MRTLYRLMRAGMHTALLFVLPWLTGALVGMVFDVREVSETIAEARPGISPNRAPSSGLTWISRLVRQSRRDPSVAIPGRVV